MKIEDEFERLEEYREDNNREAEANTLFRIGNYYIRKGEINNALESFQQSYDICRVMDNGKGKLEVMKRVIPLLIESGKLEEAEAGIDVLMKMAENHSDLSITVEGMEFQSSLLWKKNMPKEAIEKLVEASEICHSKGDEIGRAVLLEKTAPMLRMAERYKECLMVYEILAETGTKLGDIGMTAMALAGQGQMLVYLDKKAEALKLYDQSLEKYKIIGHTKYINLVESEINRLRKE